ncbi:hypothetical protein niasHT_003292 [Heterodera trifolii]|uniref:Membrane-associated protein n=1 Tax=Heterodera trifolii TaxID=157864 RepID=A0ABD2M430_9BILA
MSNLSWMILYEPREGGRMAPHPLFDPGPEMSARVIATAPLFSTSYFSTQRANESDDSVAGAVISSGGSNVAYTVTEAALMNNTTSTLMGTTSAAAVTSATAMTAAGARVDGAVQIWSTLFLFANYAIVLPMFLLCWMMVVHWLRRSGLMPPPHQSPSTPQLPHRYGGLHTIFEDTVEQKAGQEKDVRQQHQQKEQRSHTSTAATVTTEAMVREAHRVTSQLAAAIPEPMRSAVTSSVAIPMLVAAAQSGAGRKEATQHNSEEEKERN